MKSNIIPEGYRITCVSWENDGDNYKTVVKEGVSKRETELIGEVVSLIISHSTGLENNYDPSDKEREKGFKILLPVFEKFPDVLGQKYIEEIRDDGGVMLDYICENLTGYPGEDGYAMRVISSIKIEHIPQDIVIEDVTAQFFN